MLDKSKKSKLYRIPLQLPFYSFKRASELLSEITDINVKLEDIKQYENIGAITPWFSFSNHITEEKVYVKMMFDKHVDRNDIIASFFDGKQYTNGLSKLHNLSDIEELSPYAFLVRCNVSGYWSTKSQEVLFDDEEMMLFQAHRGDKDIVDITLMLLRDTPDADAVRFSWYNNALVISSELDIIANAVINNKPLAIKHDNLNFNRNELFTADKEIHKASINNAMTREIMLEGFVTLLLSQQEKYTNMTDFVNAIEKRSQDIWPELNEPPLSNVTMTKVARRLKARSKHLKAYT